MRIAIDARELVGRPTGVGRYLAELLRAWGDLPGAHAHEFILCAPDLVPLPQGRLAGFHVEAMSTAGNGTAWEQFALPHLVARARANVLFAPGYTGPVLGSLAAPFSGADVPMVVAIHDVSFAAHPEWFSWREGRRRRFVTRLAARKAARVITISDFSKQEIVRHLGVSQAKVEVIYVGSTRMTSPGLPASDGDPTVLFVGSLFNRRHIPELLAGFERVAAKHPSVRLVLVGDNRTRPYLDVDQLIAQSPARERIRALAYVGDDELASLYQQARAFVFLSEYEGFAMTPLEALGSGVPVLLLDTEVAREIYGPAATYVERPDPALIADGLERALFDEEERTRTLSSAATQLERYSWRECAQRTLQVLLACGRHNADL
jgi:glycosyltransferase involved in cell wall biosynthesis